MSADFRYRPVTGYIDNAVSIHPARCGCTECIIGDSFPIDDDFFSDELAEDILNGRRVYNSTGAPIAVTIRKRDWSDKYAMDVDCTDGDDSREVIIIK